MVLAGASVGGRNTAQDGQPRRGQPSSLTGITARHPEYLQMATAKSTTRAGRRSKARWSGRVTRTSNALDLEPGVFTFDDPREIAASLKRSADRSDRRKTDAFRSAMSMLTFYINRAGRNLPDRRRRVLERAKQELRRQYGK